MSYTFLVAQGEESSAASFSAIPASVLSRSKSTREKCSCSASATECCRASQSGTILLLLTGDRGAGGSMSSAEASRAKTSVALEKAQALGGERSGLWSDMARVIGEVRPRYVFVENSPLLVSRGLDVVLSDLAEMGYDATWGIVSASDAGAPHLRKRIWILANAQEL